MKKSLVIGMNIGQLYQQVLTNLGHQVVTVDMIRPADYVNIDGALADHTGFETAHICTPNYTHEALARRVAPYCRIVFIEKPGLPTAAAWQKLVQDFPNTKFLMVKNNQYRDNIEYLKQCAAAAEVVNLIWNNKNRIPNPGSWFTNKELAWGGVSRDLMPHLLSVYIALSPSYSVSALVSSGSAQKHTLATLTGTDYGTVNYAGVYNVDDVAHLHFCDKQDIWKLEADWKNDIADHQAIEFVYPNGTKETVYLGLCPEYAYQEMIKQAIENSNNAEWYTTQYTQDMWIHNMLTRL